MARCWKRRGEAKESRLGADVLADAWCVGRVVFSRANAPGGAVFLRTLSRRRRLCGTGGWALEGVGQRGGLTSCAGFWFGFHGCAGVPADAAIGESFGTEGWSGRLERKVGAEGC